MPNIPLFHWLSQLFDLREPLSTDVPVLLLNQAGTSFELRKTDLEEITHYLVVYKLVKLFSRYGGFVSSFMY